MKHLEIKFSGLGGQGIILAGSIIGQAVTIYDKNFATLIQSYGPESRGGACTVQLIISGKPIASPVLTQPDILVLLSQEAYYKYAHQLKPGGVLLVESDMVKLDHPPKDVKIFGIPATRLAEKIGKRITANMVMLGFFTAQTKAVSPKAIRSAIKDAVPPGTHDLNLRAFQLGYEYDKRN